MHLFSEDLEAPIWFCLMLATPEIPIHGLDDIMDNMGLFENRPPKIPILLTISYYPDQHGDLEGILSFWTHPYGSIWVIIMFYMNMAINASNISPNCLCPWRDYDKHWD